MAEEPSSPAPLGEISHGPSKFEEFLDKNQKKLVLAILAIVVALAAYIVVTGIKEGEDNTAGEALSASGISESSTYDIAALRDVMESFQSSPASGSAALLLAEEQWKDQRKDESIQTLREFLAEKPDHAGRPSALMALASHLLETDKKDEAISTFQQLIDAPGSEFLAPFALLTLADLEKAAGNEDAAKVHYEKARDAYPNNSLTIKQFVNGRLALLGVQPPAKIAPPAVPETPPAPAPRRPVPNTPFPELIPKTPAPTPAAPTPAAPTPAADETAPEEPAPAPENDAPDAPGEVDQEAEDGPK
ncbi:MAG: tetratricopeptide repeat protein [Akkermansiaceae bacterium]|nr:tetratricopeptide repeat protein [Akkermansiaceae bacterium]